MSVKDIRARLEKVQHLHQQHVSVGEIAQRLNMCEATVQAMINSPLNTVQKSELMEPTSSLVSDEPVVNTTVETSPSSVVQVVEAPQKDDTLSFLQRHERQAATVLVNEMVNGEKSADRVKAATLILERIHGKATVKTGQGNATTINIVEATALLEALREYQKTKKQFDLPSGSQLKISS